MKTTLQDKLSKVLFHGTLMDRAENIYKNGVDFSKLGDKADFGKGFYLTDNYILAESTARLRYIQEKQANLSACLPVVIKFKIIKSDSFSNLNIKEFYGESLEWKKFVATNRWHNKLLEKYPELDHNIDGKYDIVIGLTADGKMRNINQLIKLDNYNLSNEFLKNIYPLSNTFSKYINGKTILQITNPYQISFHNEQFLKSCIKYKSYDIIRLNKEDAHYE